MASLGLRGKVVLAAGAAVLVAVLATAAVASYFFVERQTTAQSSRSQAIAEALAIQLERILALHIALRDLHGFDEQCDEAIARHGGQLYAVVVDSAGQILFRSNRSLTPEPLLPAPQQLRAGGKPLIAPDGQTYLAVAPVIGSQGSQVAQVVVGFARAAVLNERNQLVTRILGVGVVVLAAVLALLGLGLSHVLVRPLNHVMRAMDRIRRGERDHPVRLARRGNDELTVLSEGFNSLVQTVWQRERELVAARDKAEAGNRAKSQFLAMMSHELRTPLNAVLGMAELLGSSRLDARQQRFVEQIRSSGRSLVEIINDVLDLSRLEAGTLRVVNKPFRLQEAVVETVEMYRERAESHSLTLVTHIDESLPDMVNGDVVHLRQILSNLLSNALKFTERGSVIVRATPSAGFVRVSVSDTGIGIAPDFLPHIYEAFRQADSSPTRRFGGTGLGLAIARRLCDAMGGRIDASSRHGKGSTFWFELPLPAVLGGATTENAMDDFTAPPRGFAANDRSESASPTAVEVLLIEDNPPNQLLVRETLVNTRYQLTVVDDGTAAVRQVLLRHFDIVLLDWELPGVDGLAVLAALREAETAQGRPRSLVIAVTAHTGPGDRETCLAAGADDYLGKPYTPAELLARMAAATVRNAPQRH